MLLVLIALVTSLRGNIAPPQAFISEILVDSTGNWTVEMGFWDTEYIDSIRMVTSAGNSIIATYSLVAAGEDAIFTYLAVITSADLVNPMTMNQEGDYVKLISYSWGDQPFDSVAFGTYPGSFLDCLMEGESIIAAIYYDNGGGIWAFCIDTSPTIGLANDTSGAMGNYSGIAFDTSGYPFTEGIIPFQGVGNLALHLNPDGSFSKRVPSRRYSFDTIRLWQSERIWKVYTTEQVDFCLRPDSSFYQDIITISLVTGLDDKEKSDENLVTIAPNPFSEKVVFYFNLKDNDPTDPMSFTIHSLDGREINHTDISPGQNRYEWAPSSSVSSGTYIYRLERNNRIVKSGKFVRL